MMEKLKKIRAGDVLVVGTSLVVLLIALVWVGYQEPLVIAPKDGFVSKDPYVLFSIEKGSVLLIDETPSFESPVKYEIKNQTIIHLKPGVYYWKVLGVKESKVRQLRIDSLVDLQLREKDENYQVINAGNDELKVSFKESDTLLRTQILGRGESANVSGNYVKGEVYNE